MSTKTLRDYPQGTAEDGAIFFWLRWECVVSSIVCLCGQDLRERLHNHVCSRSRCTPLCDVFLQCLLDQVVIEFKSLKVNANWLVWVYILKCSILSYIFCLSLCSLIIYLYCIYCWLFDELLLQASAKRINVMYLIWCMMCIAEYVGIIKFCVYINAFCM